MNKDIKVMAELQKYWDGILSSKGGIEKARAGINAIEKELAVSNIKLDATGRAVKELKNSLKQNELNLKEMGIRIEKLEDRKRIIQTEKELHALEKEIDVIKFDIGNTEDKTLLIIDTLDEKEKELQILEEEAAEIQRRHDAESSKSAETFSRFEEAIKLNEEKFNALLPELNASYKSKFTKLLNSKEGKAVARVDGEICGCCNYKIPSFLAIDASKDDKLVNCTNCGRYIYR
jgi:uncharacterized protein